MHPRPTPTLTHYHPGLNLKKPLLLFAALSGALMPWAELFAQTATNAYAVSEVVNLSQFEVQATKPDPSFDLSTSSATKTVTPLLDVPQTVNIVPRDLFVLQGARSLEDALLNVAGVSPSVGDGQRDQVYIRGFSAQYDQYLDGVRDEAMYFRDLANIDRIEVIEGPSAVLYGHGSAGGLVNRISRQPTTAATGDISATYGSWNQRRVELDSGGSLGPDGLAYRLDAAGEDSGGFRDQYFLQRYHVSPSAAWQMAPDTRILLQFDYLNDLRLDDLGIPALVGPPGSGFPGIAPAVPINSYYGMPNSFDEDYVRAGVTTATATLDHAFGPSVALHEVFRAEHYTLDRNNVLPTNVYLPAGGVYDGDLDAVWVQRSQRHILRFENDLFNQTETTWKTTAAGTDHNFLLGLEVGRQSADAHSTQYNAPAVALVDPVLTQVPAGAAPASVTSTAVRADTAGLYLQDQMTFSTQWKALAGVRLDYYEISQQNRLSPFTQIGSLSHTVSPRVGIVYEPLHNFSIYGTVSQSFSPAAGDGLSIAASTAALAPLKATNYEIGAKQLMLGDSLSATVALFQLTRNITETNPVTNLTTAAGEQRSRGIDVALAGRLNAHWSVSASYELLDPTIINGGLDSGGVLLNGKIPQLVSRNSASLYSTFDLGNGFGIGGGAVYMGGRFTSNDDSVTLPAFIVVNAVAYYRHGRWEARLNCNNVLNHRYLITAGEGTDYTGQTVMPGAPINAVGSVIWHF
jgi:catecholate siderophore receptor